MKEEVPEVWKITTGMDIRILDTTVMATENGRRFRGGNGGQRRERKANSYRKKRALELRGNEQRDNADN